jgi:hypothetical protein
MIIKSKKEICLLIRHAGDSQSPLAPETVARDQKLTIESCEELSAS